MQRAALLFVLLALGGCVSKDSLSNVEHDPWERLNRSSYLFSDGIDRVTLKPVAKGYDFVVPAWASRGVTNFSNNLTTPRSMVNNFLQGKPKAGVSDFGRFLLNSTFGLGGLLDVASMEGLEIYDEDFGQTLAVWGVPDGPYVYLPFLGPETLRDAFALPIDIMSDPLMHYEVTSVRDRINVLRIIDIRAQLFTAERFLEDSKDPYITLRESFLQNRRFEIYDGDPPVDDDFYDDFDDFEDFDADPDDGADSGQDD